MAKAFKIFSIFCILFFLKAEAVYPQAPEAPSKGSGDAQQGMSFFFDDADVYEVIQTVFGEVLKVNYIVDPKVKGRVNFRTVRPIPTADVLPVLEIIFRLNGIGVVEEKGLYRIIMISDIAKEPVSVFYGNDPADISLKGRAIVQIVPLTFISSSEMLKILNPLLTAGGMLIDIPKLNHIMVADTDANAKRLLSVIRMFDRPMPKEAAGGGVFVYPLQNSSAKHVAEILGEIFLGAKPAPQEKKEVEVVKGAETTKPQQRPSTTSTPSEPLVASGTKIFPDEFTNSIIILATHNDYLLIEDTIRKLDVIPRQVLIEVLVAEATLTDELKFGIEWFINTNFKADGSKLKGDVRFESGNIAQGLEGFSFVAVDASNVVRGLLHTLATESKLKVLASPHIMATDNREAKIQVGDQLPIETARSEAVGSERVLTSVQYRDTGVVLSVKPQINEGGLVSLDVKQEVSIASGTGVGGNPVISNRKAETHVVVQDGQTIVIGGLIQENNERSRDGIPFLSKIPVLGYLFGFTKDTVKRTELIVTITPKVARSIPEAGVVTRDFLERLKNLKRELEKQDKGGKGEANPDLGWKSIKELKEEDTKKHGKGEKTRS